MATYEVSELQPSEPGGDAYVACVNASGTAGGFTTVAQVGPEATTWPTPSNPQPVALPRSTIFDLNDNGDAVGKFSTDSALYGNAFLLRGGSVIDLGPLLPNQSEALGINNNGLITGLIFLDAKGFVYDSVAQTAPIIIPPLPGYDRSMGNAVNDSGAVAGYSGGHAILFLGGKLLDLGPATETSDINNSGVVVGSISAPSPPTNTLAAVCDTSKPNPSFTTLPLPPGGFIGSQGNAINNNGDVVGFCWTQVGGGGNQAAYIFTKGASTDLNTLISAASGWQLGSANDINDNGQIVGSGLTKWPATPISADAHLADPESSSHQADRTGWDHPWIPNH